MAIENANFAAILFVSVVTGIPSVRIVIPYYLNKLVIILIVLECSYFYKLCRHLRELYTYFLIISITFLRRLVIIQNTRLKVSLIWRVSMLRTSHLTTLIDFPDYIAIQTASASFSLHTDLRRGLDFALRCSSLEWYSDGMKLFAYKYNGSFKLRFSRIYCGADQR